MSTGIARPAEQVRPIAEALLELLAPHCAWLTIAGSLRRGAHQVSDVEIVALPLPSYLAFTDSLIATGAATKARYGEKQTPRWGPKYRGIVFRDVKFELFTCDEFNRGFIEWMRTGPDSKLDRANTFLVTQIKRTAPFRITDGYLWIGNSVQIASGKLRVNTEQEFFTLCGLPYLAPHERSTRAYTRYFGKSHRWGDPARLIVQQQVFDLGTMLEAETRHLKPGPAPVVREIISWEWEAPWLDGDQVWVYQGYGEFELLPRNSDAACQRLQALAGMPAHVRQKEAERLAAYLNVHRWSRMADVMKQMIACVRET